ncbi:hypothetical protein G0027_02315 [Acinetobacter indicus]|uniref:Uncharacterized protein n=1 Tax=Acinetobacter indicus TaxID=756892 RepID=A0A7S6VN34_9GAMM|nr:MULTISPECIES: hypothetical protein [Acinetobacter]QOW41783.1 hypothetical protein G0027_02315 [Acinetobacter indicus]
MENKSSLKEGFSFKLIGFDQSLVDQLSPFFNKSIFELSKLIDISTLEGLSFAIGDEEYLQELKSFNDHLTPSSGAAVGVAMTLTHIDRDYSRNYIVVNCRYLGLEYFLTEYTEPVSQEDMNRVMSDFLHTLFHEFCHVFGYQQLLKISPNLLTKSSFKNDWEGFMHLVSLTCWDEYQVCGWANMIGSDQQDRYESILLNVMNQFEGSIERVFKEYLESTENSRFLTLFNNTAILVLDLFKYSSYYLGDLSTKDDAIISDEVSSHKLYDVISTLNEMLSSLKSKVDTGIVENTDFYKIGEYAQQVAADLGLIVEPVDKNNMFVNLSRSAQTRILYA